MRLLLNVWLKIEHVLRSLVIFPAVAFVGSIVFGIGVTLVGASGEDKCSCRWEVLGSAPNSIADFWYVPTVYCKPALYNTC